MSDAPFDSDVPRVKRSRPRWQPLTRSYLDAPDPLDDAFRLELSDFDSLNTDDDYDRCARPWQPLPLRPVRTSVWVTRKQAEKELPFLAGASPRFLAALEALRAEAHSNAKPR